VTHRADRPDPSLRNKALAQDDKAASSDLALTAACDAGAFRKQRNHLAIECGDIVRIEFAFGCRGKSRGWSWASLLLSRSVI
jgi:hypothetical protein